MYFVYTPSIRAFAPCLKLSGWHYSTANLTPDCVTNVFVIGYVPIPPSLFVLVTARAPMTPSGATHKGNCGFVAIK